jgi:hypothetical protein
MSAFSFRRRDFLGTVFAALLLPVTALRPTRFYVQWKWKGFRPNVQNTKLIGSFWAQRNDGVYFGCYIPTEISPRLFQCVAVKALLSNKFWTGRRKMQSYLDQRCVCTTIVTWENNELGEDMPVHSHCEVHPEVWS